jgi:hypothetical protein
MMGHDAAASTKLLEALNKNVLNSSEHKLNCIYRSHLHSHNSKNCMPSEDRHLLLTLKWMLFFMTFLHKCINKNSHVFSILVTIKHKLHLFTQLMALLQHMTGTMIIFKQQCCTVTSSSLYKSANCLGRRLYTDVFYINFTSIYTYVLHWRQNCNRLAMCIGGSEGACTQLKLTKSQP